MTRVVRACQPNDTLERAAQIMWDGDIGCLPVLDDRMRPVAMVTDRDIAMAAYFQALPLRDIRVYTAMSRRLVQCSEDADLTEVEYLMQSAQIRRIPVVGPTGAIAGILTLADLVRAVSPPAQALPSVLKTVSSISEPRSLAPADMAAE